MTWEQLRNERPGAAYVEREGVTTLHYCVVVAEDNHTDMVRIRLEDVGASEEVEIPRAEFMPDRGDPPVPPHRTLTTEQLGALVSASKTRGYQHHIVPEDLVPGEVNHLVFSHRHGLGPARYYTCMVFVQQPSGFAALQRDLDVNLADLRDAAGPDEPRT